MRDASASQEEMSRAMAALLPPAEAFRAGFEVESKLLGLTPRATGG